MPGFSFTHPYSLETYMLIAFPFVAVEVWFFLFFKEDLDSEFFTLGEELLMVLVEMVTAPEAPFTAKRFVLTVTGCEVGDGSCELELELPGRAITLVSGDGGMEE